MTVMTAGMIGCLVGMLVRTHTRNVGEMIMGGTVGATACIVVELVRVAS